ncbi:cytochrome P450 [Lasiosphaeria hispida]|uniref:Cytochrome P450 n=1 Tax=Lasiosphaeria hispida TaxID=260671 RepID=A0AAJ0HSK9_9PEZI|nr:cytochrome P450 [Lasiosphaeria hispida]
MALGRSTFSLSPDRDPRPSAQAVVQQQDAAPVTYATGFCTVRLFSAHPLPRLPETALTKTHSDAWDVVGTVTFSQPIGYLSAGTEFDGTLYAVEKLLDYFSWVGCIPFLDHLLDKNRIAQFFGFSGGFSGLASICASRLPDYLGGFIEAKAADPDGTSDNKIVPRIVINMGAGANTTAITIRFALYYSLRTPGIWARLRADLAAAGFTASQCPLTLRQARTVPYLEAIIRGALRYLPGVSLGLERYVPAGGQRLALL